MYLFTCMMCNMDLPTTPIPYSLNQVYIPVLRDVFEMFKCRRKTNVLIKLIVTNGFSGF